MVGRVGIIIRKVRGMGISRYSREEKVVKYLDERLKKDRRKTQERRETDIMSGLEIEEYMSLIRSLRRGFTT